MEHVLRQCLIALRIAERTGLDEPSRAVVYYTALLINVGCHSDAHEQAGSGYPRGSAGGKVSSPARILGAADAYQAMREPRPHRAARSADETAKLLRGEARAGRFAGDAVEAVLEAAGHRARRRPEGPGGLTAREVEVLAAPGARARHQANRGAPVDVAEDRGQSHRAHLRQDRRHEPRDRELVRSSPHVAKRRAA